MATSDVPGANPANADILATGSWAEHVDKSLIFVQGVEADQVVYQIFDVAQDPPVYYQDAMRKDAFEKAFSRPPTGSSDEEWTWHDKQDFPWSRVMKTFDKPKPEHADVHDTLSAAARVAQSLRLRKERLKPETIAASTEQPARKGRSIIDRVQAAIDAFVEA